MNPYCLISESKKYFSTFFISLISRIYWKRPSFFKLQPKFPHFPQESKSKEQKFRAVELHRIWVNPEHRKYFNFKNLCLIGFKNKFNLFAWLYKVNFTNLYVVRHQFNGHFEPFICDVSWFINFSSIFYLSS